MTKEVEFPVLGKIAFKGPESRASGLAERVVGEIPLEDPKPPAAPLRAPPLRRLSGTDVVNKVGDRLGELGTQMDGERPKQDLMALAQFIAGQIDSIEELDTLLHALKANASRSNFDSSRLSGLMRYVDHSREMMES